MANKALTLLLLFGQLGFGSPAEVHGRAKCNADNCLRALQHSSALASPFCNSYLGVPPATTVTVTTTVDHFTDSPLTLIGKRSDATSFNPTACSGAPTALSSGCSCLIGTATSPTLTVTATATATLPPQCNAANNYGLITNGFGIEVGPGQVSHYYQTSEPFRGACCARCFETPNCLAFLEEVFESPNPIKCLIWEINTSPTTVQDPICPLGKVTVSLTQPTPSGNSGVGPCGIAS